MSLEERFFRGESINKRKRLIVFAIIIFAIVILVFFAFNERLTVRNYEIASNKINDNIRIAFIADLHSCYYGEGQTELLRCIDEQQPDMILFGGDIVDEF
ncbi:MAG: metallophosphoesterase, partial [Bacillota bacterium]